MINNSLSALRPFSVCYSLIVCISKCIPFGIINKHYFYRLQCCKGKVKCSNAPRDPHLTKLCPSKPLSVTDWPKHRPSPNSGQADRGFQGSPSEHSIRALGRQLPCAMGKGMAPWAATTLNSTPCHVTQYVHLKKIKHFIALLFES